jgi:hypothetical protein
MLNATLDLVVPSTIADPYPRPHWFTEELRGRSFEDALGHPRFEAHAAGRKEIKRKRYVD